MDKVSLILTTYNSADNLAKTLASIEEQDYQNIEVNIKDGGSTDRTISIIQQYAKDSHNTVNWISSPDVGIYDAMNQGYRLSSGNMILFFNDLFVDSHVISNMVSLINEHQDCIGAHADLVYATDEAIVRHWRMGRQRSVYTGWMPGHPTLFLKREIYEQYGLFNTDYRIAADYEFMLRFLKDRQKNMLAYYPEVIVSMYYGGTSTSSFKSYVASFREGCRALRDNRIHFGLIVNLLRSCRVLLQFR